MTSTSQTPDSNPIQDKAVQLSRTLHDLQGVLRSQRDVLRQRGLSLPSGVLTLLEDAQIGIQNLQTNLKEENETLQQFRALTETAAMINSTLDLDAVLNRAMDTVIHLTGAERGYLMLRHEQTGELEYRVARNLERETIEEEDFVGSRSVINQVADSGEPIVTTNAQSDPRFASQESIVAFALRSILCVPLSVRHEVIGVIYADNRIRSGLFGDNELAVLNAFANQAAVAIENARMFERTSATLQEISEIKELMDDVFVSIPSGVIVTDAQNRVQTFNTAAGEILSFDGNGQLLDVLENQITALGDGLQRLLETVRNEQRRTEIELVADVPDRGQRHLHFKLSPLRTVEAATEGVAIVLDDLTDLHQREAQLNLVRRYLPPAMVDNIQSIAQLGLGGVRREITVLYVDVRSMHTFPPELTPQQQMATLNEYMEVASTAIHEHGGVIDKFMGTEVMALFNTQLNPSETHQLDAVRAALAMADTYRGPQHATNGTYYRVGIHSGVATMGNVGSVSRREFTAIGDTVNLAHRLVDLAGTGEVLVSHDTFAPEQHQTHLDPAIDIIDRGKIDIRGRTKPVQIFQLQRRGS